MAVPSVISITPNEGSTIGQNLITIIGNDFREPTAQVPGPTGVTPVAPPSVKVTFGGVESPNVFWITQGKLLVVTPPHEEVNDGSGNIQGVDVVVSNIDDNGDVIVGEEVTVPQGYTYKYESLYQNDSKITRVTRAVIQDWKKQVHPNVVLTIHTDFDDDSTDALNITALSKLPAIVLQGPALDENRFYSVNEYSIQGDPNQPFDIVREARILDMGFDVLILSNSTVELLNLVNLATKYLHYNKFLPFQLDPNDPSSVVQIELDFDEAGDFTWDSSPNMSNIRRAKGSFILRGFCIDGPVIGQGTQVGEAAINVNTLPDEDPEFTIEQIGETYLIGPSPGDC